MNLVVRLAFVLAGFFFSMQPVFAQSLEELLKLQQIPAVTGHEQQLAKALAEYLKDLQPQTDNLGNVFVTVGSGSPHRLIATAIDEPGYVVSEITPDGYLRVQRLPQAPPNSVFDALNFAQPVVVVTRTGKQVPGVFAGLSVHLQPGRPTPPRMDHVEELYVDIGAKNADEVRVAGVDLLDPVAALSRREGAPAFTEKFTVGESGLAGPATMEGFGRQALLQLANRLNDSGATGRTTLAFLTQQWLGGRGLNRLLTEIRPDEMILIGRVNPAAVSTAEPLKPGDGLLFGLLADAKQGPQTLLGQLKALADREEIPVKVITAEPPRVAAYTKGAPLPGRFLEVSVPLLWPVTPAEFTAFSDAGRLQKLLDAYLEIRGPVEGSGYGDGFRGDETALERLSKAYGASGHETAVREEVKRQLPEWARSRLTTDAAGNLVLRLGDANRPNTPRIAFVAHMDEIGYEVKRIEDDGRLQVEVLGGGYPQYFLGHVVLVNRKDGTRVGGVLELPFGWEKPGFELPSSPRGMDEPAHVYVGTKTKVETEKLQIAPGDFVTIPKKYRSLLGTRANARSFDDRVGCAALIAAVRALGPDLPGRDVTFVWSTEEEVGLKGAAAFAEQAARDHRVPDFVFAIDTFVSSDSPLESKRFADAELGKGFVVRAVDNSNIVPVPYVDRVVGLAKDNRIPVQYGVTGGGNDGSVFTRYGSVDVALGWPLRYAHSPAEVIDTKDLDALGKIVEVLARKW